MIETGFKYLKAATTEAHRKLESVSFASEIMSRQLTDEQYRVLILNNRLIYSELEPLLNEALITDKLQKLSLFTSKRLADLDRDAAYFLDKQLPSKGKPHLEINTDSVPEILGVLYVLEGSRLGGNVIVKALKKNEHLGDFPTFHFYQQEGIDIRTRWMSLMQIGNQLLNEADSKIAAASANVVFDYFHEVFRK